MSGNLAVDSSTDKLDSDIKFFRESRKQGLRKTLIRRGEKLDDEAIKKLGFELPAHGLWILLIWWLLHIAPSRQVWDMFWVVVVPLLAVWFFLGKKIMIKLVLNPLDKLLKGKISERTDKFALWLISKMRKRDAGAGYISGKYEEKIETDDKQFALWLGLSTGQFQSLNHSNAIVAEQNICLKLPDAAQNICIFGGIGSGKTTRVIQPLLMQLLDQDAGGLIFDVKGDFKNAVAQLADKFNREIVTIGVGGQTKGINLLKGLTPEMAASFLKSAYLLGDSGHGDSFWVDSATELSRNALGLLSFAPEEYNLYGLYRMIFFDDYFNQICQQVQASDQDNQKRRHIEAYVGYFKNVYDKMEEKTRSSIKATLAKILSLFAQPDLQDAFCSESDNNADIHDILEGKIFLVDLPLARWGMAGKLTYTIIKLRYFNLLQTRPIDKSLNQDRPVFYMCDEYQEIVSCAKDGLSDLSFWDKSRSAKCIGIISGQSISSFYAAIGNKETSNTLLQNFRQKICFRTEDATTIQYFCQLGGKVERERQSFSEGPSSGGHPFGGSSTSVTSSTHVEDLFSPAYFRTLSEGSGMCFLNIAGESWDDVLVFRPVFL